MKLSVVALPVAKMLFLQFFHGGSPQLIFRLYRLTACNHQIFLGLTSVPELNTIAGDFASPPPQKADQICDVRRC